MQVSFHITIKQLIMIALFKCFLIENMAGQGDSRPMRVNYLLKIGFHLLYSDIYDLLLFLSLSASATNSVPRE